MSDVNLNSLVMKVARRAENAPADVLRDSFVPVRSLLAHLESAEHHVLFGRRGTGKTHLLRYLQDRTAAEGALAIYLDLRRIGSPGDLVPGAAGGFCEQATGLLVAVLEHIYNGVYEQVLDDRWAARLDGISVGLDGLAQAAKQVRVVAPAGGEEPAEPARESYHVVVGPLPAAVQTLASALAPHELWILIDEWSALPPDLQPLMAEMLRRTFFATSGVVVKISAIHGRSRFSDATETGPPVGL